MITTERHNNEIIGLWKDRLNEKNYKAIFILGIGDEGLSPKLYHCLLSKEEIIEFLRATADELEAGRLNTENIGTINN